MKRKLVSFVLDKQQQKPLEGHIVLNGDKYYRKRNFV